MESKETVRFNLTNTDHSWDTNAYFAVGISRDTLMGEDDVISCLIDEKLNVSCLIFIKLNVLLAQCCSLL